MSKRGNGEGTIYKSEKLGRWVGQISLGVRDDGSPIRKSVYGKTRKEVNDKITDIKAQYNQGTLIDKSNYTLEDMINICINEKLNNNIISERTYVRKKETFAVIKKMNFCYKKIQSIEACDINAELEKITGYSNSVIDKILQLISEGFNKALLLNIINYSPFDRKGLIIKPRSIKRDKKIDALTVEEQKLFVAELDKGYDKYSDILKIALYTGMRIGEILALTDESIDFKNKVIHIVRTVTTDINNELIIGKKTKTYAGTRDIPITPFIEDILKNNFKKGLLFSFEKDKIIRPSTINSHFKKICKNANIRVEIQKVQKKKNGILHDVNLKSSVVNTHMLRHTYATRCIEAGMSASVLSKLLGHTDITTTLNTYTSVFNRYKQDEIDKYLNYMSGLH